MAEVSGVVQREAVAGDPPRNPDANRGELFLTHPHACQTVNAFGLDAVIGGDANEDFLQIANVAMNVAPIRLQVDDRIADDLPWSVVSDVAAAARFEHSDSLRRERLGCRQDVRATTVTAHAERQHRRMFDKQKSVGDLVRLALFDEPPLQIECVAVCDDAEPLNFEASHQVIESITRLLDYPITRFTRRYACPESQFSIECFTCDMNSSATAPSMIRWS